MHFLSALEYTTIQLELLTGVDMLLKKGIRDKMWHATHQFAEVNNKYMKDHDKNQRPIIRYVLGC